MRYALALIVAGGIGCGDAPPGAPADLADLSAAVDMSEPADLLPPPPPPDLSPPACTGPRPGTYLELMGYSFVPLGGGVPGQTYSSSAAAVRNDGRITRPDGPLTSAGAYHCAFSEKSIDPSACTAPCCPGQPTSPIVYVDADGWIMWVGGTCAFAVGSAQYVATITSVAGNAAH